MSISQVRGDTGVGVAVDVAMAVGVGPASLSQAAINRPDSSTSNTTALLALADDFKNFEMAGDTGDI